MCPPPEFVTVLSNPQEGAHDPGEGPVCPWWCELLCLCEVPNNRTSHGHHLLSSDPSEDFLPSQVASGPPRSPLSGPGGISPVLLNLVKGLQSEFRREKPFLCPSGTPGATEKTGCVPSKCKCWLHCPDYFANEKSLLKPPKSFYQKRLCAKSHFGPASSHSQASLLQRTVFMDVNRSQVQP